MLKKPFLIFSILITLGLLLLIYLHKVAPSYITTTNNYKQGWKTYKSQEYSVSYPESVFENKLKLKRYKSGLVHISTDNYEIDNASGTISHGFSVNIIAPYYSFPECDVTKVFDTLDNEYGRCIFISSEMGLISYGNGELNFEKRKIGNNDALNFKFVSNNQRNNAEGILIRDEHNNVYVLSINYKDYQGTEVFDSIINSFVLN